ncbi:MAG: PAS domain-containing protein [bacterium]|nr:PAS domain-containing protein [bacterium]
MPAMPANFSSLWFMLPIAALAGLAGAWLVRARRGVSRGEVVASIPAALRNELWQWDVLADRMQVPASVLALTGYTREEFGTAMADLSRHVAADDREAIAARLRSLLAGEATEFTLEFKFIVRGGGHAWLAVRAAIERDERGVATRVSGTWADVTARVAAEEERDRLFNVSLDLLAVGGFDGFLHQVNPAWVRVLGWSRDELMSRAVGEFIHPEDQDLTAAAYRALAEDRVVADLGTRFRCRDGTYRWLSWSSFPYPDRRLVFSVVRDITEQKDAERRLLDYQDRLRALSAQLAVVEERERRQLAVAIHDGLAQQLFAARAKVTLLRYPEKLPDQAKIVDEALGILDDSMREARSLSFELYPPVLYEVGLEAALSWLARQWSERMGINCTVDASGAVADPLDLSEDTRALAYQSVRELLANVAKHATATEVRIALEHDADALRVSVVDNGRGLADSEGSNPGARDSGLGFGLFSIRERLRSVGGRFRLYSRPGSGCRVELSVPLADGVPGPDAPEAEA